jgi:acyl dehydratase
MSRTVTASDIERFTQISGDRNHCTTTSTRHELPDSARSSFRAALPAPSSMRSPQSACQDRHGVLNVNWDVTAPVSAGDTITGRVEVTEVRTDNAITKLRTTVHATTALLSCRAQRCYTMAITS